MIAFCNTAPCGVIEVDGRFRGVYCLRHLSEHFNETTQRYISEGYVSSRRRENLKYNETEKDHKQDVKF
jgi:hypothetical protein